MKILFWVEPLIEMERPHFKQAWASDFSAGLMRALRGSDGGRHQQLVLAAGDAIAAECEPPAGTRAVGVDSLELQRCFGDGSTLEITRGLYDGSLAGRALDAPAALIRAALGDFEPELVVTHSPAPHVARAFPGAMLLHREYSLFSRKPYPKTWYFDPCGMYRDSFLARHAAEIEQRYAPGEEQLERQRRFRERCRALLRRRSPLRAFLAECRQRFETLLLFPLQFFGYYAIDANAPCTNQLDLLLHVLERIPSDAGLIVTSHPEHNRLDRETVAWLRRRHPNLLHHPEIEATYAPSQYLLPEVDALVCLSSALGLQALFWGVPLVSVGPCYENLADAALPDLHVQSPDRHAPPPRNPLADLREVLARRPAPREALADYLLTRYSVPERFLHAPNWASAFLSRSLERWRQGAIGADFFDPIASGDELYAHLEASLDGSIPHGCGTPSIERQRRVLCGLQGRIDRVPTGETAIEHGAEEAIASALTAPGGAAREQERRQLERAASHLERMAAWVRENLRLLERTPPPPEEISRLREVLERISRTADDDPVAAAALYERLGQTPGLPPAIAAEVRLGAASAARARGETAVAARELLRALVLDPGAEQVRRELRSCLAEVAADDAPSRLATASGVAPRPAAADEPPDSSRSISGESGRSVSAATPAGETPFILHLALAPPPPDHRWRGWPELAPRLALPVRRAGRHPADWPDPAWPAATAAGASADEGATADPAVLGRLVRSAALVICEDPAAAVFCAACDEAALLLPRRSWLPLVAGTRVEPVIAPTGHLLDLTPEQVAAAAARACPGSIHELP